MEILQRIQNERIEAFNEELRRHRDEEEQKRQEELNKQKELEHQDIEQQNLNVFKSAKGMEIEYQKLDRLLVAKKWREASELTAKLMLELTNRVAQGYLEEKSIQYIPCEDLQTIDNLWVYYSNGYFGFSVQKKLWLDCGGKIGLLDNGIWDRFAARISWYHITMNTCIHKSSDEFMRDTQNGENAPIASLPYGGNLDWISGGTLFYRLDNCGL